MVLEQLCHSNKESDEVYTPFYAVDLIKPYIKKEWVVWCPFDEEWSAFVQSFKESGIKVIHSCITDGRDFFSYEPSEHYDVIISNPPFSLKDKILERCYHLNKPFALLLPVKSIQGKRRVKFFAKYGLELLVVDGRINYHTRQNFREYREGNHFGSMYFCRNILPSPLIFKFLEEYKRPLKEVL